MEVEADILNGMSAFSIVGLGDSAVQESKERIRSAIKNSGADYPQRKKIINLAPASLRKQGPQFDLPIAVSLLAASGQIMAGALNKTLIIGELALDGTVRAVSGVITAVLFARDNGWETLVIPARNHREARLVGADIKIVPVKNLTDLIAYINNPNAEQLNFQDEPEDELPSQTDTTNIAGFEDIIGQETAKRALTIAAAGGHHIALYGSPGAGKTLLARALTGILPPLADTEKTEVLQIYSVAGLLAQNEPKEITRPFRQVHQSCTLPALYGGGSHMKPGEITLAHRGVLFMDELPEFPRAHLEQLRQPLEEKVIHISRANGTVTYPAQFTLVAGMNPCPCGYFGDPKKHCVCRPWQLIQYQKKISGPIADRMDMFVEVARETGHALSPTTPKNQTARIRASVIRARELQTQRFANEPISLNAEMGPRQIKKFCPLDRETQTLLNKAAERLTLSMRKYHQLIRLARTIADLENSPRIAAPHITEALQYRQKNPAGY